ncbi:MAG: 50S ribosomal protein L9 [Bacteroidales bacterium]|nr:50S ribosomal protein L9 [Bacteroidales bacterium]MCI5619913.1 50S ribosomal protein L9 [Rikenellaceae bacterium]
MKIILKKEVANLGEAGEIVEVKTGYALNYLVPQGYAVIGTPSAIKQHEETIRQRAHKEAKNVAEAQAYAAKIASSLVKVNVKVNESGKIYGSVTPAQITEALVAAGFEVEKKNVSIVSENIETVGTYDAKVKCYKGVFADLKFEVIAE